MLRLTQQLQVVQQQCVHLLTHAASASRDDALVQAGLVDGSCCAFEGVVDKQ
jgi:hypothetical protein